MANELIIDLNTVDLNAVALGGKDIDKLLPQTGPMRQLDHLIWKDEEITCGVGVKKIRQDEFWVPYHIPGRPLMPGVMMIEAAAQLCSVLQTLAIPDIGFLGFTRCDNTSFRGQVVPGDSFYLLSRLIQRNKRRFVCTVQGVVEGKLVFESSITGMKL
ncbi:MAG: beta-hydroxyacyl-ACP dehydratase [Planctomycetes bacterium]|nr:beta-hydroxyacyl-ACP dehydratase [Planctomycetota bacterium]